MDIYTATEVAYKNGYEKGKEETAREILDKIIWFSVKRIEQTTNDSYYQISFDRLNEIAKQCGVEL